MIALCSKKISNCACLDDPLANYSAEAPDVDTFCAAATFAGPLALAMCPNGGDANNGETGSPSQLSCTKTACSTVSTEEAYLTALREAQECLWGTWSPTPCAPPPCPPCPVGCPPNCGPSCPPTCPPPCPPHCDPPPDCPPNCPPGCPPDCPPVCPPNCGPPPGCPPNCVTFYHNTEQSCTVNCSTGGTFTAVVAAGTITALTQNEANAEALALACKRAKSNKICITTSALTGGCINKDYIGRLAATGGIAWFVTEANFHFLSMNCVEDGFNTGSVFSYLWSIEAGTLPAGLTLHNCSGAITGTPTQSGQFTFTVRATDGSGAFQEKTVTLCIVEITTADPLPDATLGASYIANLTETPGIQESEKWELIDGTLPAGLSLSSAGVISGTPTGPSGSSVLKFRVTVDC